MHDTVRLTPKEQGEARYREMRKVTLIGSVIDTVLFFGVAFSAGFSFLDTGLGLEDGSLAFAVPFLGIGAEVPLWISLAAGDFCVKILVAIALLAPYRVLRGLIADRSAVPA